MVPFLSVVDAVCLFCCLFPPRTGGHSPLGGPGRPWENSTGAQLSLGNMPGSLWSKHYSCSRVLQRPSLCILGRSALFLSCQCPVALTTATSVPFACLCSTSWPGIWPLGRGWAVHSWELDHSVYHGAGFSSCLGRGACTPIWQSFQMRC